MSIEACEYARLFYHVFKGSPGSSNKKYIKKYKRRWVVLKMDFSPVECRLEHYDKESSWQNQKEGQIENLSEMSDVCVMADSEKDHVLQLRFTHRALFLSFDSTTKLNMWKQKLSSLLDRYPVQLMKCPEQQSRIGLYILDLQPSKIDVYDMQTKSLVWSWAMGHLRRFNFHANVPDVEVEAGTRSSTGEGHFYFTGVHMRRLFDGLKERIAKPPSSQPIPIPQASGNNAPPLPPRRERSKSTKKQPHNPSPQDLGDGTSSLSYRNCDAFVHTPSLNSFTSSPRMPSLGLADASSTNTVNSSFSHTDTTEFDLPSSNTTMHLSSLSAMSDYAPSDGHDAYLSDLVDPTSEDESDTSNESTYVQMSTAKEMALLSLDSSSQNDLDVIENWRFSGDCPLQQNPSYTAFNILTKS